MQKFLLFLSFIFIASACKISHEKQSSGEQPIITQVANMAAPEWTKSANIYEVNTRQYTPEGTFRAFVPHLPRLKEMGVDILWLMPVHPIGEKNRKGGMGSPYASKNYKDVNPDLGTKADFKHLVEQAHSLGLKVIIDWVANHSAFDNIWAKEHPGWYTRDENGNMTHPKDTDWTDVADLNYDNADMQNAMIDALKYWVREFDIDGYRCDVAGMVPDDFWKKAITELQSIKHVFMLAEVDDASMHDNYFHMTYGWGLHHKMNQVAKSELAPGAIDDFIKEDNGKYKPEDYRMNFTTNHDENSWSGTVYERMGDMADAMAVLAFTVQGMPLIYSGQEAGLNKRLSFFEKDSIDWADISKAGFFKKLLQLKHENKALWNGKYGGSYTRIQTNKDDAIFAFERANGDNKIIVALNLSQSGQSFAWPGYTENGKFKNIFTSEKVDMAAHKNFTLGAGEYLVLSR